jgi:hypothetical protein
MITTAQRDLITKLVAERVPAELACHMINDLDTLTVKAASARIKFLLASTYRN